MDTETLGKDRGLEGIQVQEHSTDLLVAGRGLLYGVILEKGEG